MTTPLVFARARTLALLAAAPFVLATGSAGAQAAPMTAPPVPQFDTSAYTPTQRALMKADRDFNADAQTRRAVGWNAHWAPDAANWRNSGALVQGTAKLAAAGVATFKDSTFVLEWQPVAAVEYTGSTLGATSGVYRAYTINPDRSRTLTSHGHYVTVWRKDAGEWKVILDGGFEDPK